jgi:hypothetical protein
LVGLIGTILISSFPDGAIAGKVEIAGHPQVTLVVLVQDVGAANVPVVEQTLIRAFRARGYRVLDRAMVVRTLPREVELSRRDEIEAATRFGAQFGADIVVSGRSQTRTLEKAYSLLEGKRIIVSQADVGAKAISVRSGEVLAAESAHARKPFDTSGAIALEAAAEALAEQLIKGIMRP